MNNGCVFIRLHQLKIRIATNDIRFLDYLRSHFRPILTTEEDACDVEATVNWKTDFLGKSSPRLEDGRIVGLEKIGASTLRGTNRLVRIEKIQKSKTLLQFEMSGNKLMLDALRHKKILKEKFKGNPASMFSELCYYFVYFPAFWHLETLRNTHILHASAVQRGGKAIVLMGMENTGKTVLALALSKLAENQFISDNLVLYDNAKVYSCYEPIKLRPKSEALLPEDGFERIADTKLRTLFAPVNPVQEGCAPAIFVLPSFNEESFVEEITGEQAVNMALNANDLTCEVHNYNQYANMLNLMNATKTLEPQRHCALSQLLDQAECFKLGIGRGEAIEETAQRILKLG